MNTSHVDDPGGQGKPKHLVCMYKRLHLGVTVLFLPLIAPSQLGFETAFVTLSVFALPPARPQVVRARLGGGSGQRLVMSQIDTWTLRDEQPV